MKLVLVVCALLFAVASARPQQNWNPFFVPTPRPLQKPGGPGFFPTTAPIGSSTPTTAATATTASPQYLACLQSCPTTSEYNPVCGTDNIAYHNPARLDCAVRCGRSVAAVRSGTCQAL